ncbi:MAG TPA: hypothetical protein VKA06_04145, partial [Spirochaetia bacterium]|nr:hypothetical protein [Spirochaetia bacterium]
LVAGVEGLLVPAIGFTVVSGGWSVPWGLFAVTAPLSLSIGISASLWEDAKGPRDRADLPRLVTPTGASVLALVTGSAAVAVALGGAGIGLHPELALLGSAVAVMCVFFGWISLVDTHTVWRARRVAALVTGGGVALSIGLIVVMLLA